MKVENGLGSIREGTHETCRISSTREPLGEVLNLTKAFRRFVVHHEQLPAGRRASSPHSHSHKEEIVVVLGGAPRAWIDGKFHDLAPGDYVAFEPGTGIVHYITNDYSDVAAEYLVIASLEEDDVVTYQHPSQQEPR